MVEAFAPDTADQPFYVAVLPRRCVRREEWVYAQAGYGFGEQIAELRIAISQKESGRCVITERVSQLLSTPVSGGIGRDVEMGDSPPLV